jgi:aminoglycoside 6'-N-acetyltransferase
LLAAWLRQADITRWWGDSAETLAAVLAHPVATEALIEVDAVPVGFICWRRLSPDELAAAGLSDLPADLIDVDIMIGESPFIGHGVGPAALAQLLARLRADGVPMVGLATTVTNTRALRAFERAGFHPYRDFREAGQAWRYLVQRLGATG